MAWTVAWTEGGAAANNVTMQTTFVPFREVLEISLNKLHHLIGFHHAPGALNQSGIKLTLPAYQKATYVIIFKSNRHHGVELYYESW